MKKINYKILLITSFIFLGVFSLFFVSSKKVLAQKIPGVLVETTGYSMLAANTFILNGYYEGILETEKFTTYFEYKKGDNNLDVKPETTAKIDHSWSVMPDLLTPKKEFGDFYQNPEFDLLSTYYFRAVGYFNNNPSVKYYGNVMSLNTGFVFDTIPFTVLLEEGVNVPGPFVKPVKELPTPEQCTIQQSRDPFFGLCLDHDCSSEQAWSSDINGSSDYSGKCVSISSVTPPGNNPNPGTQNNTTPEPRVGTEKLGLVPCDKDCGFKDIITLINTMINFIFKNMVIPIAAIMFAYAGFELVTSGGSTEKKSKAKEIFTNVAIGLVLSAGAFVIIHTILSIVGYSTGAGWNWFGL